MAAADESPNDLEDSFEEIGAAEISDPDDYNLRRRLQQLHNAKERVTTTAERTSIMLLDKELFTEQKRDRLVAEAVASFIDELDSLLAAKNEEISEAFNSRTIAKAGGEERTIREFRERRGQFEFTDDDGSTRVGVAPYGLSMNAHRIASEFLDAVAGPDVRANTEAVVEGFGPEGSV